MADSLPGEKAVQGGKHLNYGFKVPITANSVTVSQGEQNGFGELGLSPPAWVIDLQTSTTNLLGDLGQPAQFLPPS